MIWDGQIHSAWLGGMNNDLAIFSPDKFNVNINWCNYIRVYAGSSKLNSMFLKAVYMLKYNIIKSAMQQIYMTYHF